jgi:hypothetical protein
MKNGGHVKDETVKPPNTQRPDHIGPKHRPQFGGQASPDDVTCGQFAARSGASLSQATQPADSPLNTSWFSRQSATRTEDACSAKTLSAAEIAASSVSRSMKENIGAVPDGLKGNTV